MNARTAEIVSKCFDQLKTLIYRFHANLVKAAKLNGLFRFFLLRVVLKSSLVEITIVVQDVPAVPVPHVIRINISYQCSYLTSSLSILRFLIPIVSAG